MGSDHSFDICSNVDLQEVKNALSQAEKEVMHRYDLQGSDSKLEFNDSEKKITIESQDDYKVKAVIEILKQKLIKRGISVKALVYGSLDQSLGGRCKQEVTLQQGIPIEKAKDIVKEIKQTKIKVQTQIQGEQVRVVSSKIDLLQDVMKHLKTKDFGIHMDFANYR